MTRRLLWNGALAVTVLVALGWLSGHLATASLDEALREAQAAAPTALFSSAPPGLRPPRACVDWPEIEPLAIARRAPAARSPRLPLSPFEEARVLAAAIWHVLRQPEDSVRLAALNPSYTPPGPGGRILLNRWTSQLWNLPGPWSAARSLAAVACHLPGVEPATLRDFLLQNPDVGPVGPVAGLPAPLSIVDIAPRDWKARMELEDRFPDTRGLMAATKPGIGRGGREAVVYVEITGNEGWFLLLRSNAGRWRVVETSQIWIS